MREWPSSQDKRVVSADKTWPADAANDSEAAANETRSTLASPARNATAKDSATDKSLLKQGVTPPTSFDGTSSSTPKPLIHVRTSTALEEDPVAAHEQQRQEWSRLFSKPIAPLCESHSEPCKAMLARKPGVNCGRSFWMCARPLGPSGAKERGTQWRCPTFVWCSEWNGHAAAAGGKGKE